MFIIFIYVSVHPGLHIPLSQNKFFSQCVRSLHVSFSSANGIQILTLLIEPQYSFELQFASVSHVQYELQPPPR
jgi:hypothetical protein